MKRYKIDLSAEEFFNMVRSGAIDKETEFEAYDVAEPAAPVAKLKLPATKPRKPRRTKAQIEADKKQAAGLAEESAKNTADANQRAFPWQDASMNTAAE